MVSAEGDVVGVGIEKGRGGRETGAAGAVGVEVVGGMILVRNTKAVICVKWTEEVVVMVGERVGLGVATEHTAPLPARRIREIGQGPEGTGIATVSIVTRGMTCRAPLINKTASLRRWLSSPAVERVVLPGSGRVTEAFLLTLALVIDRTIG